MHTESQTAFESLSHQQFAMCHGELLFAKHKPKAGLGMQDSSCVSSDPDTSIAISRICCPADIHAGKGDWPQLCVLWNRWVWWWHMTTFLTLFICEEVLHIYRKHNVWRDTYFPDNDYPHSWEPSVRSFHQNGYRLFVRYLKDALSCMKFPCTNICKL